MAVSADPGEALRTGRRTLEQFAAEVTITSDWSRHEPYWRLDLTLRPRCIAASSQVPASTAWVVLVTDRYPADFIGLYPAREGGITATFPHQRPNRDLGNAWRTGNICTSESVSGAPLAIARDEPRTPDDRLAWHVGRALDWLRDAAAGTLVKTGDPFELPLYADEGDGDWTLAFSEDPASFTQWNAVTTRAGTATLSVVGRDREHLVVRGYRADGRTVKLAMPWGIHIASLPVVTTGVWIRLPEAPVVAPWGPPATWGELASALRAQGIDLFALMRPLADRIRDDRPHSLLLGFPIALRVGEPMSQMHWIAAELPVLNTASARTPINGFRPAAARWLKDREGPLADATAITWAPSENWHPRQLGARGAFAGTLAIRPVVLIGGGALGSAMANLFVRGGVPELATIDKDRLIGGNLVRHELTMDDLGDAKSVALAAHLNASVPSAHVRGYDDAVPVTRDDAKAELARAALVIDTTGSDDVIDALDEMPWSAHTSVVSVSLSYGATRVYLYVAPKGSFSAGAFRDAIAPWLLRDPVGADRMTPLAGCWSPVFPARHDDVVALAALTCRHLDRLNLAAIAAPELRVFERAEDGTIVRCQ